MGHIFCVQGNADSTASVLWARRFHYSRTGSDPSKVGFDTTIRRTNVLNQKNKSPSKIYPTLKINPGDIKIIIECTIHYTRDEVYSFTDGRKPSNVSPSEVFGLLLYKLSPPKTRDGITNDALYFNSVVIFTPKPGLFDETPPR